MTLGTAASLLALCGLLGLAGAALLWSPVALGLAAAQLVGAVCAWLLALGLSPSMSTITIPTTETSR